MAKEKSPLERDASFIVCQSTRIGKSGEYLGYSNEVAFVSNKTVLDTLPYNFTSRAVSPSFSLFTGYTTNSVYNNLPFCDVAYPSGYYSPSGDYTSDSILYQARLNIHACDYQSGVLTGLTPTVGSGVPSSMSEVFDYSGVNDVRNIGLRMPMMIVGWGYTTEGFPTPSMYDHNMKYSGDYTPTFEDAERDKRTFAPNFTKRNDLFPAGPLDLRYDKSRKMWRSTPEVYGGYTLNNIASASGRFAPSGCNFASGELEILVNAFEPAYTPESNHKLLIINRSVTNDIPSGTWVIAIRANNGEFWPIYVDCAPDRSGVYV